MHQPRAAVRGEAGLAGLAALLVLVSRRSAVTAFALLVAGSALGAVLFYRYVEAHPRCASTTPPTKG